MDESEAFANNPFRDLAEKISPAEAGETKLRSRIPGRKIRIKGKADKENPPSQVSEEDSALFLGALGKLHPEKENQGGFLLEDQACWSKEFSSAQKQRRSKASQVTAQAKPARQISAQKTSKQLTQLEDTEIFSRAVVGVQALAARGRHVPASKQIPNPPSPREPSFREMVESKLEFAVSFSEEYLEGHVVGLDELVLNRLRSGQFSPEAHLDLHGLNAMQAFENLRAFMRSAWLRGLRLVLLVPGRGRNSPNGFGILREKLQIWLTQEPFKRVILAFCTAKPKDGGPGSIYVLLRTQRKKGRIYWDRHPSDPDLF